MAKFTTKQAIEFGDSRDWRQGCKRLWAQFRRFHGLPGKGCEFQLAEAFCAIYEQLRTMAGEERDRIAEMLDVEAEAELKRLRKAAEAQHEAEADRQRDVAKKDRDILAAHWRSRRVWRLCGLFLEDRSMNRYTLTELEQWRDWAAYWRFRPGSFELRVEAVNAEEGLLVSLDWTDYFTDVCGDGRPFDMEAICKDLREYTEQRRLMAATNN